MSTKSMLRQAKLNEWAVRFSDQKASGLTVKEWCSQNNLSRDKFFYWKRLLKENAIEQALPEIVPLAMPLVPEPVNSTPVSSDTTDDACESCASCTSCASNSCARKLFIRIILNLIIYYNSIWIFLLLQMMICDYNINIFFF